MLKTQRTVYDLDRSTNIHVLKQGDSIRCVEINQNGKWFAALQRFECGKWEEIQGSRESKTFEEILVLRSQCQG